MRTLRTTRLALLLALAAITPTTALADPTSLARYGWVVNGFVDETIARGRTLFVSGGFTTLAPLQNRIGSFATLDQGSSHPTRLPAAVEGGTVAAIADDGAGGWYLGGSFTSVGGTARANIAHIRPDGSLDPGFAPVVSGAVSALLRRGTTLYAIGGITSVGGVARGGGAAFDPSGTLLPWNPQVQAPSAVGGALVAVGNAIFLGGTFTTVGGSPRAGIAAVNDSAGELLPLVANLSGGSALVSALALRGNTMYIGGSFTAINGIPRGNLGAIDITTGTVLNYQADANGIVRSLLAADAGVYVGGLMTTLGGQTRRFVGLTDPVTGSLAPWSPDANGSVQAMALSGTSLLLVGTFTTIDGNGRAHAAAVDATGSGAVRAWNPGLNQPGVSIAVDATGTVAVGGLFSHYGATSRQRLAAIDTVTGTLEPFAPRVDNSVIDMELVEDTLYLAGVFTRINGIERLGFGAVDVPTGDVLGWNPAASTASGRSVTAAGGTVFLGGFFTTIGGQPRQGFAQVDATGGAPTGLVLNTNAGGGASTLRAVGSTLVIGGNFASIGGQARSRLAALDLGTNTLTNFAPAVTGTGASVNALAATGDTLYVGGTFTALAGEARTHAGAVSLTTGAVLPFAPVLDQPVFDLAVSTDSVYLAGNFTAVNGQPRQMAAAVDAATGATTRAFSTGGFAGTGRHVAIGDEGLWVGANGITSGSSYLRFFPDDRMGGLPGAPSAPTVNISGALLTLRWSPATLGGTPIDYIVEAGSGPGLADIATLPVGSATTQFTYTPVPGGRYYMRVRARSAAGVGSASPEVAFSAGVAGCSGAPQPAVGRATVLAGQVSFVWDDPVSAAAGVNYVLEAGSAPGAANLVTVNAGAARTFSAQAPPGVYYVRVRASSACGEAPASPEMTVAVGAPPPPPPVPSAQVTGSAVAITWPAVAGAAGYRLEAGTGPGRTDAAVVTVTGPALNAVAPPGTYYVRVLALGASAASAPSRELVVVVP